MLREAVRRHRVGLSRNRARRNAIRPGHGTAVPLRHTERAWFIGTGTLPPGNVGATHRVARRGPCGGAPGMMRSHDDSNDPHPALRAGLSLAGRGVSLLLRWEQTAAFCPLARPTCTLPPGNVGATRWVARWVRRTRGGLVGLSGVVVYDGGRAIYRDGIAAARHGAG
jgi:hypothetical protein